MNPEQALKIIDGIEEVRGNLPEDGGKHGRERMYGRCRKCGRKLIDPLSMERGYGPKCWDKVEGAKASSSHAQTMPGQLSIDDLEG